MGNWFGQVGVQGEGQAKAQERGGMLRVGGEGNVRGKRKWDEEWESVVWGEEQKRCVSSSSLPKQRMRV